MPEMDILKVLLGGGTTGAVLLTLWGVWKAGSVAIDKLTAASAAKDAIFTAALREITAENKTAINDLANKMNLGLDRLQTAVVTIDRDHTSQTRETFSQVIQLTDRQNIATNAISVKVDRLSDSVDEMRDTLGEQGMKIDHLARSLPPPPARLTDSPGNPPGDDFRPPRA